MSGNQPGEPVSDGDYMAIQRFLHHEAALLDGRDYKSWLDLLTDDITYRITAQVSRRAEDGIEDYAIVDDDADALHLRVAQISDPKLTHAENPPSMARRNLSNFLISHGDAPDSFMSRCNLLLYRNRGSVPEGHIYSGERRDVIRRVNGDFRLARRDVRLDQTTLFEGVLSVLL
jgi:3-phenylpropionate/cinnamic acid dioxygenase small subunit